MLTVVLLMPDHTQDFSSSSADLCNPCKAKNIFPGRLLYASWPKVSPVT